MTRVPAPRPALAPPGSGLSPQAAGGPGTGPKRDTPPPPHHRPVSHRCPLGLQIPQGSAPPAPALPGQAVAMRAGSCSSLRNRNRTQPRRFPHRQDTPDGPSSGSTLPDHQPRRATAAPHLPAPQLGAGQLRVKKVSHRHRSHLHPKVCPGCCLEQGSLMAQFPRCLFHLLAHTSPPGLLEARASVHPSF